MFNKTKTLEKNSPTASTPAKLSTEISQQATRSDLFERIRKDPVQFDLTDMGVLLPPQHFFSLKGVYKNRAVTQGILLDEVIKQKTV